MADNQKAAIEAWLSERFGDAEVIASNPYILDRAAESYGYSGIYVLNASGQITSKAKKSPEIDAVWLRESRDVLAGRSDRKVDFRFLGPQNNIMVVFSIPYGSGESTNVNGLTASVPTGMVVLVVDPGKWLYQLIKKQPVPTKSAESLLMRREADRIVYLSPVRHKKQAPLTFSIPLDERRIAAYFAVRGEEIFGEFIDYNGIPVFASTRQIKGSDWGLVVKINRSEALYYYYRELLYAGFAVFAFLFMTAGIGYGIWKSQRLRYFKALALREEKYHILMEQAKDIILFFDHDMRIVEANKAALGAYGYSREEILSLSIMDLRAPDTRQSVNQQFAEALRQGLVFESVHIRKDGTAFPVLVSTRGAEINRERFVVSIIHDDTERKRVEEELRGYRSHLEELVKERTADVFRVNEQLKLEILEREQIEKSLQERESILRGFFDSSPFMMGVVEITDNNILHISDNKASADFFKTRKENMHGKFSSDLGLSESLIAQWISMYGEAKRKNQPVNFEFFYGEGEALRWLSANVMYLPDESGGSPRFCYIVLDITNRKKTEMELEIYHQNLEELVQERTGELQRSNRDLEQFAYVASHDLQEPLRMVSSYVQLLAKRYGDKLDEEAGEFIAYAVDGATRMQTLINDLLTYSRVGTRGQPFIDANAVDALNRAISVLAMVFEDRNALVTMDALPVVYADHSQLVQLFQNLLTNAVKFNTSTRPAIHISAEKKGMEWIFSVRDNGIGLDQEYRDRIFVIFQRLHKKDEYPGTGIGLSICKKIVERHGGRIWVDSVPGEGSTFYFSIPLKGGSE